jgi:hypothetical protein
MTKPFIMTPPDSTTTSIAPPTFAPAPGASRVMKFAPDFSAAVSTKFVKRQG